MGNLTALINKIEPAVEAVKEPADPDQRNSKNLEFVDSVSEKNVHMTIKNIRKSSPILAEMEKNGEITICGGMYSVSSGEVKFYEDAV
jgi:carbonic anhydrase